MPNRALDETALALAPVEFDRWRGVSFGTYLAPKKDFVTDDGGVDLVFHFHAAQMAERHWRSSGANAVVVSATFGIGSGAYSDALSNPARFGRMIDEVVHDIEAKGPRKGLHARRVSLVSWSAGFGAVGKILGVERYYAMIDTVVLLDSLQSAYMADPARAGTCCQGASRVDLKLIGAFVRFARDAALGHKEMVITHSSIVPPDYASSTEATTALLESIGVEQHDVAPAPDQPMTLTSRADSGNLHVRGFKGRGPADHFQHLYLVGEIMRELVVPRWMRLDRSALRQARAEAP